MQIKQETGVHVFVLGGTGFIGTSVVRALIRRGHRLTGLARSETSAERLRDAGSLPLMGDIASPASWIEQLPPIDAVIHLACDLDTDMATVDHRLLDALLQRLAGQRQRPRFIYTGGCWLFGATGNNVATEATPFSPLPAFAWMVPHARRILSSPAVEGIVVHPAMVYTADGGVFSRFAEDDAAPPGASYIGAAIEGLEVGRIAHAFAKRFGQLDQPPRIISADQVARELGAWARGYALDQRLSGAKACAELGWRPAHLDPEGEIAALMD
jgi:nucleoside-diphosphate-sugar epimerase